MEEIFAKFIDTWVAISGMLVVNFGLTLSIAGAVKIYRADSPRSDWILESAYAIAERPTHTYARIAPAGGIHDTEMELAYNRARDLSEQIEKYNRNNKDGMKLIFRGFIIQFIGNSVWGWLYLYF